MSASVNFTTPNVERTHPDILQTAFRRRLQAELSGIREEIRAFNENDIITQDIARWEQEFTQALQRPSVNERNVLIEYITILQGILIDSITLTPLDDQPLLGTDKKTYGYKHLCIFLCASSDEARDRSPIDSDNEELFLTKEHSLAKHMINWLKRHDAKLESEEINRDFSQLSPDRIQYIIPNEINNRIFNIQKLQRQREKRESSRFNDLRDRVTKDFQDQMRNVRKEFFENQAQTNSRLDEMEEDSVFDEMEATVEELDEKIKKDEEEIERLKNRLNHLKEDINSAEKDDLEVKIKIKEFNKALIERKKARIRAMWKAVARAAISIATSIALNYALPFVGESLKGAFILTDKKSQIFLTFTK